MCYTERGPQIKALKTGAPYQNGKSSSHICMGQKTVPENATQGTQLGQSKPSSCLRKLNQDFLLPKLMIFNKHEKLGLNYYQLLHFFNLLSESPILMGGFLALESTDGKMS